MGMAIRTGELLALNISPFIWDLIAGFGAHLVAADLGRIDEFIPKTLRMLRHAEEQGITEETFEYYLGDETFTTTSLDDRQVELVSGGASVKVTFENRCEYADALERYRLHEFDTQVREIKRCSSSSCYCCW